VICDRKDEVRNDLMADEAGSRSADVGRFQRGVGGAGSRRCENVPNGAASRPTQRRRSQDSGAPLTTFGLRRRMDDAMPERLEGSH
jgi:hypothetical protein